MRYSAGRSDSHLPALRDIHIERVRCRKAGRAIGLAGLAESWIENVTFTDMDLRADKSVNTRYTRGVRFDRVNITTPDSPVFTTQDTVDMTITRSRCPEGAGTFLSVGPGSASIRLIANDLSAARSSVQIAGGLAEDTVVIQDQSH
jgi:hypothetical protein